MGQFPAASFSNRSSCAVAWLVPDMATVRTGSTGRPACPRYPTPNTRGGDGRRGERGERYRRGNGITAGGGAGARSSAGGSSGGGPACSSSAWTRCEPLALAGLEVLAENVGSVRHPELVLQLAREAAQRRPRTRLDGAERQPEVSAISLCDIPLQYASSTSERSFPGNVSSARWTRQETQSVSAASGRAGIACRDVRRVGDGRVGSAPEPVDDRVARDGVEPRRGSAARRVVPGRRAPDTREGVLRRILGATAVADPRRAMPSTERAYRR